MADAKRIGIILQGGAHWMGGVEYSKNLIKALYLSNPEQELYILAESPLDPALYKDMPARFTRDLIEDTRPKRTGCLFANLRKLLGLPNPWVLEQARLCNIDFLYPFTLPQSHSIASAAWLFDFQHKYYPQFFTRLRLWARNRMFKSIIRKASRIVLSSRHAESDCLRFFPESQGKTHVLSFSTVPAPEWFSTDAGAVQLRYELPDRFFIVCNQFWQHKNHVVVFKALEILKRRGVCPIVVCTGAFTDDRRPTAYQRHYKEILEQGGVSEQVRLLGLIPRGDQIQLMRKSLAVIQPSLFEGWSTVVEDARTLGKPMLLSDIPVHREQDPQGAVFFAAEDAEQLASIMESQWLILHSGPHFVAEAVSRQNNQTQIASYATRFLQMAYK